MTTEELIKEHTITDKQALRKACNAPACMPDEFLPKKLAPIAFSKFKGDKMPLGWSVNDQFEKGQIYPIYNNEGMFAIGKDGKGKGIVPTAWQRFVYV